MVLFDGFPSGAEAEHFGGCSGVEGTLGLISPVLEQGFALAAVVSYLPLAV